MMGSSIDFEAGFRRHVVSVANCHATTAAQFKSGALVRNPADRAEVLMLLDRAQRSMQKAHEVLFRPEPTALTEEWAVTVQTENLSPKDVRRYEDAVFIVRALDARQAASLVTFAHPKLEGSVTSRPLKEWLTEQEVSAYVELSVGEVN